MADEKQLAEARMTYTTLSCACATVERYHDRFLALNRGQLSLSDFAQAKSLPNREGFLSLIS